MKKYFLAALANDELTGMPTGDAQTWFTSQNSVNYYNAYTCQTIAYSGTGKAMVCDLSGKIVAELMLAGDNTVALPAGIYFVKTGDTVCKVIVGSR